MARHLGISDDFLLERYRLSRKSLVLISQVKFIYIAHFKTTVVDQSAVHKDNIKKTEQKTRRLKIAY